MLLIKTIYKLIKKINLKLFIYGFGQCFNLITPLLAAPIIISRCGVENFGKTGVGMALSFFLVVIVDFGSDIIGVKEVSINRENHKVLEKIFVTTYATKFLLTFFLIIILSVLFLYLPWFKMEKGLFFLSLPILIGQLINPIWFLQGVDEFNWITFLNIASKALYLLCVFLFVTTPNDYIYVNFFWGIGMIIPFLIGFQKCRKVYKISFKTLQKEAVLIQLKQGYKFSISQLFLSLKNYSPIMLIGFIGGYTIAGQYKIIEQIIMPFRTYLQVFFRFFYPKLCYEIFKNKKRGIAYWKKINGFNFFIILFLLIMIFLFSENILAFFKVEKTNISNLATILKYALLIPMFITASSTLEQLLFSIEKTDIYINITISTVIFNFFLMFILFQSDSLLGLISSILITECIVIVSYTVILKLFFNQLVNEDANNL